MQQAVCSSAGNKGDKITSGLSYTIRWCHFVHKRKLFCFFLHPAFHPHPSHLSISVLLPKHLYPCFYYIFPSFIHTHTHTSKHKQSGTICGTAGNTGDVWSRDHAVGLSNVSVRSMRWIHKYTAHTGHLHLCLTGSVNFMFSRSSH